MARKSKDPEIVVEAENNATAVNTTTLNTTAPNYRVPTNPIPEGLSINTTSPQEPSTPVSPDSVNTIPKTQSELLQETLVVLQQKVEAKEITNVLMFIQNSGSTDWETIVSLNEANRFSLVGYLMSFVSQLTNAK